MSLGVGRFRVPASVEFAARLLLAARRRFLPRPRGASQAPAGSDVELPASQAAEALAVLGIKPGDLLMVHSSGSALNPWGWEPSDLIDFLLDYLGPQGTLAMPSHPRLRKRDGRQVYDLRRSPSTVGLVTELFRRRSGVLRSGFPLSAAAASGVRAEELIGEHARSWAPHDEHSPYARLAELGGRVLCVGCSLDRMTILHVAEDLLREQLPVRDFYVARQLSVQDGDRCSPITVHQRAPWLWWYLNLGRWTYDMHRHGLARSSRVAGVTLHAAEARDTVDWMTGELKAGRWIYPLAWANRWLRLGAPGVEHEA